MYVIPVNTASSRSVSASNIRLRSLVRYLLSHEHCPVPRRYSLVNIQPHRAPHGGWTHLKLQLRAIELTVLPVNFTDSRTALIRPNDRRLGAGRYDVYGRSCL